MQIPGAFIAFSLVDHIDKTREITEEKFFNTNNVVLTKNQKTRLFSNLEAQCMFVLRKVWGVNKTQIEKKLLKIDLVYITENREFYLKPLPDNNLQVFFLIPTVPEVWIYKIA